MTSQLAEKIVNHAPGKAAAPYDVETVKASFISALLRADRLDFPYPIHLLSDMFPQKLIDEMARLPFPASARLDYGVGKREANNDYRNYFDQARQQEFSQCKIVAEVLQSPAAIAVIEHVCHVDLKGTYLRIEYAQDGDGFWLEPHTDIGVKKFTMMVYLSSDEDAKNWGTSIYTKDKKPFFNAPYQAGHGLIFVPSNITYHGYEPRPMKGVRKSLVVNFVTNEWRNRHELAFPEQPIGG